MEPIELQTRHGPLRGRATGHGTPLVLLHGNPGESSDYGAVIPSLAEHFRVLALDWPGYGTTPAPVPPERASIHTFTEMLLDALEVLGPSVIVGNSVGGYAAVRAAVERSKKVKALVLVNPAGFTPQDMLTKLVCKVRGSRFGAKYLALPMAKVQLFSKTQTTRSMVSRLEGRSNETCQVDAAVWRSFATVDLDLEALARTAIAPTLLIWGRLDPTLLYERDGRRAVQALPKAKLQLMDTGHAAFAEAPEQFLSLVNGFLSQVAVR